MGEGQSERGKKGGREGERERGSVRGGSSVQNTNQLVMNELQCL